MAFMPSVPTLQHTQCYLLYLHFNRYFNTSLFRFNKVIGTVVRLTAAVMLAGPQTRGARERDHRLSPTAGAFPRCTHLG